MFSTLNTNPDEDIPASDVVASFANLFDLKQLGALAGAAATATLH